ncbi:MAG: hypothetical protein GWN58_53955 [Anaerolineae bacterium]|nr:hypothetical protein [Anaerolineae bacterium]
MLTKEVHFYDPQTGREFTRTYYSLPLADLRDIATEKGLIFDYRPAEITVYEDGREVGYCTSKSDLLHFLDRWNDDDLIDLNDPPAWALGQDPDRCDDCGTLLVEEGDSILCPTCERS